MCAEIRNTWVNALASFFAVAGACELYFFAVPSASQLLYLFLLPRKVTPDRDVHRNLNHVRWDSQDNLSILS
jgi:hypothetical protein